MTRLLEHAIAAANNLPPDARDDIARVHPPPDRR